jgi:hypothetical protein
MLKRSYASGGLVKNKYDLFEECPHNLPLWRDSMSGFQFTRSRLQALAQISENQYFAIDLATGEVLAFLSKRAMLADSSRFQKLKDEARAVLQMYGKSGSRKARGDLPLICAPIAVN